MTAHTNTCTTARSWLAAHRDGEAEPDDNASSHLQTCPSCRTWTTAFDQVSRQVRLRAPEPAAALSAAVARIANEHPLHPAAVRGRRLLIAAAVTGVVAFVLSAAGLLGHSHLGSADGRQAEALSLSLIAGYALAAWRPERLAAGLLPVAAFAAAITLALSIAEVSSGAISIVDEIAHLPLALGAVGAAVAAHETTPSTARPRNHPVAAPHAV